jgi:hypothetical protein
MNAKRPAAARRKEKAPGGNLSRRSQQRRRRSQDDLDLRWRLCGILQACLAENEVRDPDEALVTLLEDALELLAWQDA